MRQPYVRFEVNFSKEETNSMEKADCGCEDIDPAVVGRFQHTTNCTRYATLMGWGPVPIGHTTLGSYVSVFRLSSGKFVWSHTDKLDGARHDVAIRGRAR